MSKFIQRKIEIFIFVFCLFFQNFSIFYTKDFGIAALTAFLIYVSIKNKYYLNINKKYIITVVFILIAILLSSLINSFLNIMQVIRLLMILFIIYSTYKYMKDIYKEKLINYFYKIFFAFLIMFTVYGIYELIAVKFGMPLFFNFFSNNPSYGARGIFEGYGGWSNTNRIYTAFFEPSAYGIFLVNSLFFMQIFEMPKKNKMFVSLLTILNIVLTFARSAWILLLFYVGYFIFLKCFSKQKIIKKIGEYCIIAFPFIAFVAMIVLGLNLFDDLSSLGRTYSSIYYFNNSFESIKYFLFGHGYGSILHIQGPIYLNNVLIENYAHNGYIDIIYQLGWPFFIMLIFFLKKVIDKNATNNICLAYLVIFSLSSFGTMYSIESLICLVVIIYSCCSLKEDHKSSIQNYKCVKNDSNDIMVSICCITYNQEEYIKDALDGILNQKTSFKYEIIVHDDASTDNTVKIIEEYQKKYPNIIKPIYQKENQYSKGINKILMNVFNKAEGKYIAFCEGDDYWNDYNKLEEQVCYMESNKSCSFTFHNAEILDASTGNLKTFIPFNRVAAKYVKENNNYSVEELEMIEFIPTASIMFRKKHVKSIPKWFEECYVGDWPLRLIMTSFGYAHFIDKKMCVYRLNAKGSVTVENQEIEKSSYEGKKDILEKKKFILKNINEFTNYEYNDIFEKRIKQNLAIYLISIGRSKEVLEKKYLNSFDKLTKCKFLIEIYFPSFYKFLKKIKKGFDVK